jgi:hypothetical protein
VSRRDHRFLRAFRQLGTLLSDYDGREAVTFDVRAAHHGGVGPGPDPAKTIKIDAAESCKPRFDMPKQLIALPLDSRRMRPSSRKGTTEGARFMSCSALPRY